MPGDAQGNCMTFRNGLTLPATSMIAVRIGAYMGGATVAAGSFAMTAPVTVDATLPADVADGDYPVLDVSATSATLDLSGFTLQVAPEDANRCNLRLVQSGKVLVLRVGVNTGTTILVR